jgi:hypothetical protein
MTTKTTFIGVASHTDHPNYHALTCLPSFVTFFVMLYLVLISPHLSLLSPTKKFLHKLRTMSLDKASIQTHSYEPGQCPYKHSNL